MKVTKKSRKVTKKSKKKTHRGKHCQKFAYIDLGDEKKGQKE